MLLTPTIAYVIAGYNPGRPAGDRRRIRQESRDLQHAFVTDLLDATIYSPPLSVFLRVYQYERNLVLRWLKFLYTISPC